MTTENHQSTPSNKPLGPVWKINVQGVVIESTKPEITVRHAIKEAGFDPDMPWIIVLKVTGQPKREVDLSFVIDLRQEGIEKLRLTPRQINNGEVNHPQRMDFSMLPGDEAHLNRLGLAWETTVHGGRRWMLIRNYPVPAGYSVNVVDVAIEVPVAYPTAQLDMFYCYPPLALVTGMAIPQTQNQETIEGRAFQRWSRHRDWQPSKDTLVTHIALIDESLNREVGA